MTQGQRARTEPQRHRRAAISRCPAALPLRNARCSSTDATPAVSDHEPWPDEVAPKPTRPERQAKISADAYLTPQKHSTFSNALI
eukprot:506225-Alexandrium_andersonii.AAC.1